MPFSLFPNSTRNAATARVTTSLTVGTSLLLLAGQAAFAAEPIAEVASIRGVAEAVGTDGNRRALSRGDTLYAGEEVMSGAGSSAGFWMDTALVQLDERSRARLAAYDAGLAQVALQEGAVRVVDPRDSGDAIQLVALDASTRVAGGDAEVRILREKTGAYALMCDWEEPISVARTGAGSAGNRAGGGAQGAESHTAPAPGGCVVANNREPLFDAPAHANRISILDGAPTLADAGPAINVANLIGGPGDLLPSVAAGGGFGGGGGGLAGILGNPAAIAGSPLDLLSPCGTINGACSDALGGGGNGGGNGGEPPITIIETPPTTSPFPGAGGFPGAGEG